jgi:hypothetical protein
VVDLDGDSSSEGEGSARKWRDYEVETSIAIRGEMEEEFLRCAKKQGLLLLLFFFLEGSVFCFVCIAHIKNFKKKFWILQKLDPGLK